MIRTVSKSVEDSLRRKADKVDVLYSVLLAEYLQGVDDWNSVDTKLSQNQYAFNRVNSYTANLR